MGSSMSLTTTMCRKFANVLQVAANLVEPGENALVLHTGYFGDSFADWYVKCCVIELFRDSLHI